MKIIDSCLVVSDISLQEAALTQVKCCLLKHQSAISKQSIRMSGKFFSLHKHSLLFEQFIFNDQEANLWLEREFSWMQFEKTLLLGLCHQRVVNC